MRKLLSKALHSRLETYHPTKGDMVAAINRNLALVGYHLEDNDCMDIPGDAGSKLIGIVCDDTDENVACISFSWYRMESGRYELTAYVT